MKTNALIALSLFVALGFSACSSDSSDRIEAGLQAARSGDYAGAMTEWKPLAELGNAEAQFHLGVLYFEGLGVAQDDRTAQFWFGKAAVGGNSRAQTNLGLMYGSGRAGTLDQHLAVRWLLRAAGQGDALAQFNVGSHYLNGLGVEKNEREAYERFRLSAAQNEIDALNTLGSMFEQGRAVQSDPVVAYAFYSLAAQQDAAHGSGANRTRIAGQLSETQLAEAELLLGEMSKPGNVLDALDAFLSR
jgi:TPR repeat protein